MIATKGTPRQMLAKITPLRAHVGVAEEVDVAAVISPAASATREMIENCES